MARWNGTTTQRGYNGHHQTLRQQRLAAYRPGDVCANGGEPLNYPLPVRRGGKLISPYLDLPHNEARTGYLPGLSCRKHNRADGAVRSNQGQPRLILARGGETICTICGKPYHYAPRICEVCNAHYHPNHREQRSCSRTCGMEIRKRNRAINGPTKAARRRTCSCQGKRHTCFVKITWATCSVCGKPFIKRDRSVACSDECLAQHQATRQAEYLERTQDERSAVTRQRNDQLGEARGWPRGRGAYNVGREPWNKGMRSARRW